MRIFAALASIARAARRSLLRLTWRNILRGAGLGGMMYQVFFVKHPDATLLLALAAMMGLPTFFGLEAAAHSQSDSDQMKPLPHPSPAPLPEPSPPEEDA